ncbi:hypothetical protein [Kitasatospora cathayae]|uniref:Lipoprotein n=1 Tax=Kitasatospora cathayae TaxID=3004092 RepID=A0ABY7Q421_9ACTN|nr:hypothetical protein [Kitasatospora sp. HUAS 3-15]WBP87374.1 hypothetical protein O1G21_17010 [Kitasatospora sp. HUAS 3-15]
MTAGRRVQRLAAVICAGLLVTGCSLVDRTRSVHWDLRNSHRGADLGVKLNPHSGHDFNDLGPLDIDLPGGQRFHADKMFLVVAATHDDAENIDELLCWYPEMPLETAYKKALELARQFHLKTDGIEDFHQNVLDDLAKGDRARLGSEEGGTDAPLLTPDGPLVGVSLRYETVNNGQPVTIKISFAWGDNLRLTLRDQATQSATATPP